MGHEGSVDVTDRVPVDPIEERMSLDLVDAETGLGVTQKAVIPRVCE